MIFKDYICESSIDQWTSHLKSQHTDDNVRELEELIDKATDLAGVPPGQAAFALEELMPVLDEMFNLVQKMKYKK